MFKKVFIQNYNESKELELIRKHSFPLLIQKSAAVHAKGNDESRWTIDKAIEYTSEEVFIIELDCMRFNLLENCKIRQYISYKMQTSLENERVTVLALKHEYRSYITECVVFYERLALLLTYLEKSYKKDGISFENEISNLHKFFNPVVIEQRNTNIHQHYISKQSFKKAELIEAKLHDIQYKGYYSAELQKKLLTELGLIIKEELEWFKYTETEFTYFLHKFFDCLACKIILNEKLIIPQFLPTNMSFSSNIKVDFRRRLGPKGHNNLFEFALK